MNVERKCRKCKNKVTQPVFCRNCESCFHPSCARGSVCCGEKDIDYEDPTDFKIDNFLNKENIETKDILKVIVELYKIIEQQSQTIKALVDKSKNNELSNKIDEISCKLETLTRNELPVFNNATKSYSSVTKTDNILIIQPKEKTEAQNIREDIRRTIDPVKLQVGIKMGKQTKNGGIILRCENNESISTLKENIQSKLNKKYNIEEPKSLKPRVKIVGIHEENDDENLLERIITQNKLETTLSDLKVVHTSKPIKKRYNLTMECTHQLRDVLLKRENIFVGWMRCKVYEDLKIIRCYNCQKYGHIAKECKNSLRCPRCAENHSSNDCQNENKNCANCCDAKQKYNLDLDTQHTVWDSNCQCLLRIMNNQREKIHKPI